MAQLSFVIADGILTVGSAGRTTNYYSTDFKAKSIGDRVVVYPMDGTGNAAYTNRVWDECYSDITINGVTPISAHNAVDLFNQVAGVSIGFNTEYPQHIISEAIAVGNDVAVQLTPYAKAGYLTITAPEENINDVYIGGIDVSTASYHLAAGQSVYVELFNLSTYYALGGDSHCEISILGAYKD